MIKLIFLSLLSLFVSQSFSCELTLPGHILKLKERLSINDLSKNDCSQSIVQNVLDKLSQVEGRVLTQTLHNGNVLIFPRAIEVSGLEALVSKKIQLPEGMKLFNVKTLTNKSFIDIEDTNFQIECSHCNTPGQKQVRLTALNEKQNYTLTFTTHIKSLSTYLVATRDLPANDSNLSFSDFMVVTDYTDSKLKFFPVTERVEFHRTARPLKKGQRVEANMMIAKELVKFGNKVSVLFQNEEIEIKSSAIARRAGKYGEHIELVNPVSNRKITAKIVDFNKAIVDL